MTSDKSQITQALRKRVLDHFQDLPFWADYWDGAAVAVVGSSTRGVADKFNDIDIVVFVDATSWRPMYEHYRREIQAGNINVLNLAALEYDEFPLTHIDKVKGEYKLETYESLEHAVVGEFDDVKRWVHASSVVLHDPTGRYTDIRRQCSEYPDHIWEAKLTDHYLKAWKAAGGAKNSLRRNEREAVVLRACEFLGSVVEMR